LKPAELTPQRPPRLPEPLLGTTCTVVVPDSRGLWWAWRFVWGEYDGSAPVLMGGSRPEVFRTLQEHRPEGRLWVQPE
jgi:hypothetical protein